ncbi:hypothetical protein KJ359_005425 [Pestalotiopsis sp. 9143b]|nr:hypothetical protein KJ359_005425 [Pestalotiopsis sp. 9143b]
MSQASPPIRQLKLTPPALEELAETIAYEFRTCFLESSVEVTTPPDLRQPPFHLAAPGLCGNPRIADVGGPSNFVPRPNLSAKYDLLKISESMELSRESGLLIGAGAGPFFELGVNCELMPNLAYGSVAGSETSLRNYTRYAKVEENGRVFCGEIGRATGAGLMCNLFGCDGQAGPLLHIKAKGRLGPDSFTQSIQVALRKRYEDRLISLGGVFVMRAGKARLHVMPDFPGRAFGPEYQIKDWLKFFEADAPIVCLSVLHSGDDQGLDLRMEHTHCFATGGEHACRTGGHYHGDLDETMLEVEYEGWFNTADAIYRIDAPNDAKP